MPELLVERRDGRHADVMEQQGVAVGLGLRRLQRAHRAAGAADILHDHALAKPGLQAVRQHARQEIRGPARRIGRDQRDGMAGIRLLRRCRQREQDREKQSRDAAHEILPDVLLGRMLRQADRLYQRRQGRKLCL
jgi:hypothetical protein